MNRINGIPKPSFRGFENQTHGIRTIRVRTGQRIFVEDPKTGRVFPVWVKAKKEIPTWIFKGGRWISWASIQDEKTLEQHRAAPKSKKYAPPKLKEEAPTPEPKRQVVVRRRKGERKMSRVSCI